MAKLDIAERIFEVLSDKPISFHRLCRRSGLHPKTVKRYLELIQGVQLNEKVEVERKGFRVFIKKQRSTLAGQKQPVPGFV